MSAREQLRAMLDELMGTTHNDFQEGHSNCFIRYDDLKVCRAFLLGCCPHDILSATKIDLGSCDKIHSPAFKADYEKEISKGKHLNYELDALEVLEIFIARADKRKEAVKKKLEDTQEELSEDAAEKLTEMNEFDEQIGTKLAKAEEFGNTGQVDESIKLLQEVDELKKKKDELKSAFRNSVPGSLHQQQMLRVCDICGAYLGIQDNDKRLAEHFGGKLHIGFKQIRETLEELREKTKYMKCLIVKEERLYKRKPSPRRRSRSRDRSSSSRHKRSSKKSRNRSRSRSYSRDRHSSSHRKRSRSSSRKHRKHSHSRRHKKKKSSHRRSPDATSHTESQSP